MKISYNWLKKHLNTELPIEEVSVILTDIGLEVEGISTFESVKGGLVGLIIGEVKSVSPHPNADRLQLTKIDVGHADLLDIVCGAPNVALGQKVVVALVGSTLYDGEKGFEIKKSKIRGEVSEGMLCAEDEIGLGESHDGILILDATAKIGTPVSEYFNISTDTVFEIGLTPNRIDAASHFGVARDLAVYLKLNEGIELSQTDLTAFKVQNNNLPFEVEIQDFGACPRYSGLSISGIKVAESPQWLQNSLKSIGLKPINNVVDATNYVLHDVGQPLHAFDAKHISANKVLVKWATEGQLFTTLDGVERKLSAEDLMICNEKEPMCIAGVFGGAHSGVNSETTSIFLESAYFNSVCVRKTAKRHGLNTDASFRYERGADPNITVNALKQAAILIQELAGGEVSSEIIDIYPKAIEDTIVELNYKNVDKLIGQHIDKGIVKSILENLELKILNENKDTLRLSVPAYRVDVTREVDLIEEILRIYGYNRIELPDFLRTNITAVEKNSPYKVENKVANYMSSKGFSEIFNNSLTNPNLYEKENDLVHMLNPLSKETEVLRGTMLYGGLENIAYNQNRRRKSLKFYEFGKTYAHKEKVDFEETRRLAIWMTGDTQSESWEAKQQDVNYFNLKEEVENVLLSLGIKKWKALETSDANFEFLQEIVNRKNQFVRFGKLSKNELKKFDVKEAVYYAEFNWDLILQNLPSKNIQYKAITKYPSVRRDLALLIDESVKFDQIKSLAKETEKRLLKEINLFDVYEGKNLAANKKSYAVSFTFQDESKTLTDQHIDKVMDRLIKALKTELKAELR